MNGQTCVLVCVTAQKDCARLIRRGREIAAEKGTGLKVLHVCTRKSQPQEDAAILNELRTAVKDKD